MLSYWTWLNVFVTWLVINLSNFKLCPVIFVKKDWKLFSSYLGFKVIYQQSRVNEPKDIYLPRNISNNHVCALFSALILLKWLDENQAIDNRIILSDETGAL